MSALVHALAAASAWRQKPGSDLPLCNSVVFKLLGALGVLGVDAYARSRCLEASPTLAFLLQSCTEDFALPEVPPRPLDDDEVDDELAEEEEGGEPGARLSGCLGPWRMQQVQVVRHNRVSDEWMSLAFLNS